MAASAARLAANRANAQKSTGPRTSAGKARSARNSRKHGLFSRDFTLPPEFAAEAVRLATVLSEEFTHPSLRPVATQRALLRAERMYAKRLLIGFYNDYFASPDPRAFLHVHGPFLAALRRFSGRIDRATRACDRVLLEALAPRRPAPVLPSPRPKSLAAAAGAPIRPCENEPNPPAPTPSRPCENEPNAPAPASIPPCENEPIAQPRYNGKEERQPP